MHLRSITLSTFLLLLTVAAGAASPSPNPSTTISTEKLNVLFIAVDDLRPELSCYGAPLVRTPNIDALASRSLTFNRAYCQYPLCSPSRVSLLTGLRPDTVRVYDLKSNFRDTSPGTVSLPQLFKQNGYHTRSIGKIFHATSGPLSDPESWSQPPVAGRDIAPTPDGQKRKAHGLSYEAPDVPDNHLPDGDAADIAIAALRENAARPFFLAVGFAKPHLPFVAPAKYWLRYNETSVPLAEYRKPPEGAPDFATNDSGELRQYSDIPKRPEAIPDTQQERLKAGYLACVEYMDAQVGRVINELDRLGLREKTVIVLWGDHGYQLSDHGTWTKHTTWEASARVPLLLADPTGKGAGKKSDALVELVDVFPTLTELCGVEPTSGLEGTSLVPLLADPARPWKTAAFTIHPKHVRGTGHVMADSIRTDRYRFTEWYVRDWDAFRKTQPNTEEAKQHQSGQAKTVAYELYDLKTDPNETRNLANDPNHKAQVEQLKTQLHKGWKSAQRNP